jgi:hypothetical protein
MVFFRGKFRHVSSSDSEDEGDNPPKPAPGLLGDTATELVLGMGCIFVAALITLAVMAVVMQAQRVFGDVGLAYGTLPVELLQALGDS